MKFLGRLGRGSRNKRLDFDGDPNSNQDPEILKGFLDEISGGVGVTQ